ncbi:MAG TPA: ABC transporter permease [Lachnospiraceae bacterium]|nr:ABC transporter permease [Lachnospiraceae bacterium]
MRSFNAVIKKEIMEQYRSGRLFILAAVFVILGLMNPLITKLTPWLMEQLADQMAEEGFVIKNIKADASVSWGQFYKNMPMGLIAFLIMFCSVLTKEIQSGTMILTLTKGLRRSKVILSKLLIMIVLWSAFFWICYGITYGYNEYYWDNNVVYHIEMAALFWYIFGLMLIFAVMLFSTMSSSGSMVLGGVALVFVICYVLSMLPVVKDYAPLRLIEAGAILDGKAAVGDYIIPAVFAGEFALLSLVLSLCIFNRRKL